MLLTIKTPYTCMEFQVTSMQARQLIDEAYQMAVSTLNEEDSNNPLFCPPFDLPDVSEQYGLFPLHVRLYSGWTAYAHTDLSRFLKLPADL